MSSRTRYVMLILSGVLLGAAYPPVPTGVTAFVAFVPLLFVLREAQRYRPALRDAYLVFLVVNVSALFWTGGFAHAKDLYLMVAGVLLVVAHPLFFLIPIALWLFIRKHFGFTVALWLLPTLWVSFEFLHASTQLSFPWLMLSNTQTYNPDVMQIVSVTGAYGLSWWIVLINVVVFLLLERWTSGSWRIFSVPSLILALCLIVLQMVPRIYGDRMLSESRSVPSADSIRVAIVQPNIDPFEKWQGSPDQQLQNIVGLTTPLRGKNIDLVLWPETAIPVYLLQPQNDRYFSKIRSMVDTLQISLLSGVPDIVFYSSGENIPRGSKKSAGGQFYNTYNSSLLLQPGVPAIQKYAKMNLVPFAERVPYSEYLTFLNAAQWNFGLGGWGIGREPTIFRLTRKNGEAVSFSNLICYESIYPGFVSGFTRRGAEFLTIVTNDSWWGNTAGVYQHKQFAALRAVENRRWIVQCANGGISAVVNPEGMITTETAFNTAGVAVVSIALRRDLTFYTVHGDWFAEVCLVISLFFVVASIGNILYHNIRRRQGSSPGAGRGHQDGALA